MSLRATVIVVAAVWIPTIVLLHSCVNLGVRPFAASGERLGADGRERFRVGFLPVTCHLTCPVADFINRETEGEGLFRPIRFNGWPELKEAFLSGHLRSTFILAPMAIRLREEGVPIKIVHLGHRDGSALVVHRDSGIFSIEDLRGRTIAVPNRFSNQQLLIHKALRDRGMSISDVRIIEMAPPDMPVSLATRAVDAITSGEPFMGQAELDGYGRVLYLTKDIWPGFISCVLAVHEDAIANDRETVQRLVDGIVQSGLWIDESMDNRMHAAQFVARRYYNQDPRLLEFVLSKPPDRVTYTDLALRRPDFEEIVALGVEAGILDGTASFEEYADPSFDRPRGELAPFDWRRTTDVVDPELSAGHAESGR